MKKFAFLILTVLLSISSYAQFGLKGGVDYGSVAGRDATSYRWGFHGGMTYDFQVSEMMYIQPGALLSFHSFGFKERNFIKGGKTNKLNLEMPILVSFRPQIDNHGTKLVIDFGPYIKYGIAGDKNILLQNLSAGALEINGSFYDDSYSQNKPTPADGTDSKSTFEFNRLDVGLTAGIGIEVMNIFGGISYQYGLTEAEKKNSDTHNSIFRFSLGYKF